MFGAVRFGLILFGWVWFGLVWFGLVWFGLGWFGLVWFGLVWFGLVWFGLVWFDGVGLGWVWVGFVVFVVHVIIVGGRGGWGRGWGANEKEAVYVHVRSRDFGPACGLASLDFRSGGSFDLLLRSLGWSAGWGSVGFGRLAQPADFSARDCSFFGRRP